MRPFILGFIGLTLIAAGPVRADQAEASHKPNVIALPSDISTHHVVTLPDRELRFTATAGSLALRDAKNAPLTDIAFIAYQSDGADPTMRPVTFIFNGGPGMASAWLQMGAVGPWRVRFDPASDTPSTSPVPIANVDTWLDFTDLVFIDPPGTGYSSILAADPEARQNLWSVQGDIAVLADAIRRWLDHTGRNVSPKYILGESYGGFRGPRLVRQLAADEGVAVSGLLLLSPLLDVHVMSGYADPMAWVDLLPSEVAVVRAEHGPLTRADLADVEAYAAGDYLVDILHGSSDAAALDRLTARVTSLTGLDPAIVRRLGGRLDRSVFQHNLLPGQVSSAYDGTVTRPNPYPRAADGSFPDPVLSGWEAPVTSAMLAVYQQLNWRPDMVYHLSNGAVFTAWNWGRGMGRPESFTAMQAARSVDPHLRILIAHGMFDLVTPYFATERMLRLLPVLSGAEPIALHVYSGGHMFYFDDASRSALHNDAKAVFDPVNQKGASR